MNCEDALAYINDKLDSEDEGSFCCNPLDTLTALNFITKLLACQLASGGSTAACVCENLEEIIEDLNTIEGQSITEIVKDQSNILNSIATYTDCACQSLSLDGISVTEYVAGLSGQLAALSDQINTLSSYVDTIKTATDCACQSLNFEGSSVTEYVASLSGQLAALSDQINTLSSYVDSIKTSTTAIDGSTSELATLAAPAYDLNTDTHVIGNTVAVTLPAIYRKFLIIKNNSTGILYIKYSNTVTAVDHTFEVPNGATWEMQDSWAGEVSYICAVGAGLVHVTEGVL